MNPGTVIDSSTFDREEADRKLPLHWIHVKTVVVLLRDNIHFASPLDCHWRCDYRSEGS